MFEYQVIPAPRKGKKARGIKGTEARFAHTLQEVLNDAAADGWEYVRADTLPSEERSGLTGRSTTYQNMLVFRRPVDVAESEEIAEAETEVPAAAKVPAAEPEVAPVEEHHAPSLPSAGEANAVPENAPEVEREQS